MEKISAIIKIVNNSQTKIENFSIFSESTNDVSIMGIYPKNMANKEIQKFFSELGKKQTLFLKRIGMNDFNEFIKYHSLQMDVPFELHFAINDQPGCLKGQFLFSVMQFQAHKVQVDFEHPIHIKTRDYAPLDFILDFIMPEAEIVIRLDFEYENTQL